MSLTAHNIARRPKRMHASQVAGLIGQSSYIDQADALLRKILQRRGEWNEPPGITYPQELGHALEPAAVRWAAEERGITIGNRNVRRVSACGLFACTLDAIDKMGVVSIDAKTSGLVSGHVDEAWGDPADGDAIPVEYLIQFAVQMYVVPSIQVVLVPAYLRSGKRLYEVRRDQSEELIAWVIEEGRRVWEWVLKEQVPDELTPSLDIAKRLKRANKITMLADAIAESVDSIVASRKRAEAAFRDVKDAEDRVKALALQNIGDANVGLSSFGRLEVRRVQVRGYTVEPREDVRVLWIPNGTPLLESQGG